MASKICQSCGMPLSKDPQGGGSEADGGKSTVYCSLCYGEGKLYYEGEDVREFQKMVVDKMVENGWWRSLAWLFTRSIPSLSRWKKK